MEVVLFPWVMGGGSEKYKDSSKEENVNAEVLSTRLIIHALCDGGCLDKICKVCNPVVFFLMSPVGNCGNSG